MFPEAPQDLNQPPHFGKKKKDCSTKEVLKNGEGKGFHIQLVSPLCQEYAMCFTVPWPLKSPPASLSDILLFPFHQGGNHGPRGGSMAKHGFCKAYACAYTLLFPTQQLRFSQYFKLAHGGVWGLCPPVLDS